MLDRFEAAVNLKDWPQKAKYPPALDVPCPRARIEGKKREELQWQKLIQGMQKLIEDFEETEGQQCQTASFYRSELVSNVARSFKQHCLNSVDESVLPPTLFDPDRHHSDEGVAYRFSDPFLFGVSGASHLFLDLAAVFPVNLTEEQGRSVSLAAQKLVKSIMKLTEASSEQVELILNIRHRKPNVTGLYELTDSGLDVSVKVAKALSGACDFKDPKTFSRSFCPAYYSDFVSQYIKMLSRLSLGVR